MIVSVLVFLLVAGFITKIAIEKITKSITEREVARITKNEVGRLTQEETERITNSITEQKTREITEGILGKNSQVELKKIECDKTLSKRRYGSGAYYEGYLFEDHLHMPFTFDVSPELYKQADFNAPILEKEVAVGNIICIFDREKINSAIGFYVVPSLLKVQALPLIEEIEKQYSGRVVPFLMTPHVSGLDLKAKDIEEILNSNKGLFKGLGEFAFYKGSLKGISPDNPSMLEIYKVADEFNLVVMIHPDQNQKSAVENVLKSNPNVKFLFHGPEIEPYIMEILGKYSNAYYSVDTWLFELPADRNVASLYGSKTEEEFISELTANFDKIIDSNINVWKPGMEKYPDKFLWGTDRAFSWHFDPEVAEVIDDMSRSFIGRLDPDAQDKYAHKNAEKLLNG